MKKWSICLKLILTAILLLPATASYAQHQPTVNEILTGRASETQSASSLVQRGREKTQQGNFREAIADFNQALRLEPNLPQAYYYRGVAQRQLFHSPNFRKAYIQARLVRGIARLQLGDSLGAYADLTYVLRQDPHSSVAYFNRGLARLELGHRQQAMADLAKARTLEPSGSLAYEPSF